MLTSRTTGACLVLAAFTFWISWVLMPGIGVVDARVILEHVAQQRGSVSASVVAQLVSAALFAPGLLGVAALAARRRSRLLEAAAVLLLVGAMGSAADAIYHLVAYEMTEPSAPVQAMLPVMERLQAGAPRYLGFMVAAFFAGTIALGVGMVRVVLASRLCPLLAAIGIALITAGGFLPQGPGLHRAVGLVALALLSGSLCTAGLALARDRS